MKIEKSNVTVKIIQNGAIGVIPTDTIYGLVGSAFSKNAVERIYRVRKRNKGKPFIVLISSIHDLRKFNIMLDQRMKKFLNLVWPGPISVILKCESRKFKYLHRGTNTVAFRMPKPSWLRILLQKTGPLVAPSANIEGKPPAKTIKEAKRYFGDQIDFYIDAGTLRSNPSLLIEIKR